MNRDKSVFFGLKYARSRCNWRDDMIFSGADKNDDDDDDNIEF